MRNILLIVAVFGLLLLVTAETQAQCSCKKEYIDITPRAEFKLAHLVFIGKVVELKKSPANENGHYTETVTFEVTKAWKHDLKSTITLTNWIYGCINGYEVNREWLVYAYQEKNGSLTSYCCCTRTRPLDKADEDVKEFANDPQAKVVGPEKSNQ